MGMLLHRHFREQGKPAPKVENVEVKTEPKQGEPKPRAKK